MSGTSSISALVATSGTATASGTGAASTTGSGMTKASMLRSRAASSVRDVERCTRRARAGRRSAVPRRSLRSRSARPLPRWRSRRSVRAPERSAARAASRSVTASPRSRARRAARSRTCRATRPARRAGGRTWAFGVQARQHPAVDGQIRAVAVVVAEHDGTTAANVLAASRAAPSVRVAQYPNAGRTAERFHVIALLVLEAGRRIPKYRVA